MYYTIEISLDFTSKKWDLNNTCYEINACDFYKCYNYGVMFICTLMAIYVFWCEIYLICVIKN